ncbi:growth/differentiation factor 10 [Betta splendens]|uniref:Growth/differentiation factor 10 n=1 Tax=Betta splendens TaxID=158456 RepID=A0A6P7PU02_BETSP|nr:growth/differentiation factor 10 [Betta splendens]
MTALSMISSRAFLLVLNCFVGAASVRNLRGGSWDAQDGGFVQFPSDAFSGVLDQDMVSQHMSKLYEKCNKESRLKEGNTVRSFRATQDSSDRRTVYRLNLTTLQDSEFILSATFHFQLNRRPHPKPWFCKRFKGPSCGSSGVQSSPSVSLFLHSVSSGSEVRSGSAGSFLGNVTFHPHRRGVWQMKDVTQVIKEARKAGHLLLSVELDLGQQHHSKPVEALSAGNMPYLLAYANDRALAEPNSVAASLQRYDPFSEGAEASHSSQLLHPPNSPSEARVRKRKEATPLSEPIQNNELPEVDYMPEGYRKDELWEKTWYQALKPKPKSGRKQKRRKGHEEEAAEEGAEAQVPKGERTPQGPKPDESAAKKPKDSHAGGGGRRHERRNEDKEGRKHKGSDGAQSPVLSFDEHTMRKARRRQWGSAQHTGCSRKNLRVDFADIGWSEWIVAPKAFDAYYCAGTCAFPMPKVARPSNHATIQSIVRAVGIVPGVPKPCCVPERMAPLAVLYRDESRNPVLKVYPNMSVQSCSCR